MEYLIHIAILASIYGILALGLNLVVGCTGLVSLASAGFYGIGAYATAILLSRAEFSFGGALIIAGVVSAIAAALISGVLSRFRDDTYMLVSLGFVNILAGVFVNWTDLTGGPLGIAGISRPTIAGISFSSQHAFLFLSLLILACVWGVVSWISASSFGRALKGIREDEVMMQVLGYRTEQYKFLVFVLCAVLSSVAGSLYATYVSFIDPGTFTLNESIVILSMIILGGLASVRGSLLGAIFLVLLPEALRFIGFPGSLAGQLRELTLGVLLVAVVMARPQGLVGTYRL